MLSNSVCKEDGSGPGDGRDQGPGSCQTHQRTQLWSKWPIEVGLVLYVWQRHVYGTCSSPIKRA